MDEFSHLKSTLLAEQVEEQIYHFILDTPLSPGSKLPNEFELGEKFGVGRSTIREAVKLLSSKGIVEVRRGSGTYVLTTALGVGDPLGLSAVQDKTALALDLVNVRLLLEPGISAMSPLYLACVTAAIAGGSTVCSHFNDSGFWLVKSLVGMDEKTTLKTWTIMETLVGGVGFLVALVISFFA